MCVWLTHYYKSSLQLVPCALLDLVIYPHTYHSHLSKVMWAMIEPSTVHYVFALGFARFLGSAPWIIQVYESAGAYLFLLGNGYFWLPTVLIGWGFKLSS
ncbi:putative ER lumen protein retaining receptor [Helianthus annuus]|nr:putative ER lumen protein retaining receptor [Helianthus annuus]